MVPPGAGGRGAGGGGVAGVGDLAGAPGGGRGPPWAVGGAVALAAFSALLAPLGAMATAPKPCSDTQGITAAWLPDELVSAAKTSTCDPGDTWLVVVANTSCCP